MVKLIFVIVCLIAAFDGSSSSIEPSSPTIIYCRFGVYRFTRIGEVYECKVGSDPNITSTESAVISEFSGEHKRSKNTNDVVSFYASWKTIKYFPKGLDKFFKNIKVVFLEFCQLKEIHQTDLKVFPDLAYFGLDGNEIKVIEAGLFDFNPNLKVVEFSEPEIIHIDPNVFDHLINLSDFWLSKVPCVGHENVYDSKEEVQEAIKVVKSNCTNSAFSG